MVPCEQQLDMGESILRDREIPYLKVRNSYQLRLLSKGNRVNIPEPGGGYCVVTQTKAETSAVALGRVFFSF